MTIFSALRGILLAVAALAASAASADTFTWVMRNAHPNIIEIKFYSQDRNAYWPAGNKVYKLTDRNARNFRLSCNTGEYICYGGWVTGHPNGTYWGVGFNNQYRCQSCCYVCDGGKSRLLTITD